MPLLKLENVNYSYPQSTKKALENISFEVEKGEYIAVVGTNGSGKSTLARMIAGFFECDDGNFTLENRVMPGIVFQQPKEQIVAGIVERDTAFGPQNLDISKDEIELRTIECLSVVGLTHKALSRTFELSLGQTQRVAFAGILALFPDLLILDEVTAMLDPASRSEILTFVNEWNQKGHTIIHITHDFKEVMDAKRVIVLEKGKIIFDGTTQSFAENTEVVNKVFCDEYSALKCRVNKKFTKAENSLEVKNLCFGYENDKVLNNVSFCLKKGSLTALTGPSGCGKSTLFECLSGLKNIQSGSVKSSSRPVLALQESEAALFKTYAADDVAFGAENNGLKDKELVDAVKKSMNLAGLPFSEFADRATFNLSGGEKRKLSLAGIIALDKDIMIFDEPTSALDSQSRKNVLEALRSLAESGKTVLFSTHRLEEASIADTEIKWDSLINGEYSSFEENQELKENTKIENSRMIEDLQKAGGAIISPANCPSSLISKTKGWFKFLLFLVIFIGSISLKGTIPTVIALCLVTLYAILAKYPFKKAFASLKVLLPWIIFFALFEMIFFKVDGNILFQWKFFTVTDEKLYSVLKLFLRAYNAIVSIGAFVYTTNEREILDGLAVLLTPLAKIKIPVRYVVLVAGIIFRYIPLLLDEMTGIIKTQIIRGAFANKKGIRKIATIVPLFVPILLQTFRKAQYLSDALTARYFK